MAFELREGQGSLFKNEKKTEDRQPDYTGNIMLGGEKKRLAGWKKQGKNGGSFLSVQVSEFRQAETTQQSSQDNDLPF